MFWPKFDSASSMGELNRSEIGQIGLNFLEFNDSIVEIHIYILNQYLKSLSKLINIIY
mgnify:CR=1 FL=1